MKIDVSHGFYSAGKRNILKDISFSFAGEGILSIIGPNGAGKTTLLKAITGLLPWTKGETRFDGIPRCRWKNTDFWTKVGYVPQAKHGRYFNMTVADMVVQGRSAGIGIFSRPGIKDWTAADRALEETGIASFADRLCGELSGGELQLALIARALARDPELLVLDEPEANLDFRNRLIVRDVVCRFVSSGRGAVISTHFPENALQYSKHCLLLSEEGKALFGPVSETITEENLSELFSTDIRICRTKEFTTVTPVSIHR